MTSHIDFPPIEGITYEDRLPVSWEVSYSLPSDSEQHRFDTNNHELLDALLILGEATQDAEDEAEGVGHGDLRRLDVKLNLLMSLVRELLAAAVTLPKEQPILLGVKGLSISGADTAGMQVGQLLKIRLFLDPNFPRPFVFFARVTVVANDAFSVAHCPLSEAIQDLFDKYVFRHHRRAIAMNRQRDGIPS